MENIIGGYTIGVGTGLYYSREYIFRKIGQAVADYSKGMVENIKKEEEQKNAEEHFEKFKRGVLGIYKFLITLREHLSITLDVRPTLKLLKKATEDKDLEQKVVYWKTLLDLKIARVVCGALTALCVLDTSFRVQFSILHRESRKRKKKAAEMPMIEEVKDDDETKGEEGQDWVDISAETRAEFMRKVGPRLAKN